MSYITPKVGDYGFAIVLTLTDATGTAVNISTATTKSYNIRKPDQTVSTVTATFVSDGSEGKLTWTVTTGFFTLAGEYQIEAYVTDGSTYAKRSSLATISVGLAVA